MDHLAWNLGDPTGDMTLVVSNGVTYHLHPMKGPMTTQTLRGLINMAPYHWRGDKPNFAAFNGAFSALMGGPELSDADMAAYTNFINTVMFLPNPNQKLDRSLPTSLNGGNPVQGEIDYMTLNLGLNGNNCNFCHTANPGPGSNRLLNPFIPQPLKTPHLRNVYQKLLYNRSNKQNIDGFGLDSEGGQSGLFEMLAGGPAFKNYTNTERMDIAAYEMCFDTGTAPAVGYTRTLTAANVTSGPVQSDWATLQSQASKGNIDLIGRGTIQGQLHGLLYQPAGGTYISDTGTVYTQTQLQGYVQNDGDTISIMGVYPGTGTTH
jgi:hypothetical protein